jgi:hypothetical protein
MGFIGPTEGGIRESCQEAEEDVPLVENVVTEGDTIEKETGHADQVHGEVARINGDEVEEYVDPRLPPKNALKNGDDERVPLDGGGNCRRIIFSRGCLGTPNVEQSLHYKWVF